HSRVLVPTTNPARTGPLLKAVAPFLNAEDSRGTLLGVIEMAPERPLSEGVEVARAYRALLSRITRYAERGPGELRGQVRIAHVAAQGIREAALETDTNLLVLEAGDGQGRDGLWVNAVEDLLADPPCDVALVRPDTAPIRSVLVPVPGRLLRRLPGSVMVVKSGAPVTEIKDPDRPFRVESRAAAAERVDRWFAENTFHSREFGDLRRLVDLKQRQGVTISLGLPTLNEQ